MLFHILLGAVAIGAIFILMNYVQKKEIAMPWWGWLLTVLGILYTMFVLEVFFGFWTEGESQAALVMGGMLAVVSVIWGVLMARFVFIKKEA